jgi:hypothetical protein
MLCHGPTAKQAEPSRHAGPPCLPSAPTPTAPPPTHPHPLLPTTQVLKAAAEEGQPQLQRSAAQCMGRLPRAMGDADAWSDLTRRVLLSAHDLLDVLLLGLEPPAVDPKYREHLQAGAGEALPVYSLESGPAGLSLAVGTEARWCVSTPELWGEQAIPEPLRLLPENAGLYDNGSATTCV